MNNSLYKKMIMILYFLTLLFSLFSNSFFFLWICLELNMILIVPLCNKFSNLMINNLMKYFIFQSISSTIFLYFILMNFMFYQMFYTIMIFFSMWMKLGFFPFNSWYFQTTENMDWILWFLLNSFQKLIPLWVISMIFINFKFVNIMIYMNSFYSFFEIWNQTSFRWMMNASSLNHFNWMIISFNSYFSVWETYMLLYIFMLYMIFIFLKFKNWNSIFNMFNKNILENWLLFMMMMMFMGIPPLMGFFPKLMIIYSNFSLMNCLFLILINIFIAILYFYFTLTNTSKDMFMKLHKFKMKLMLIMKFMLILMINILFFMF